MLDPIIVNLENAPNGSRELDAAIENYLSGGSDKDLSYILTDLEGIVRAAYYTTSIDVARSIILPGWRLDKLEHAGDFRRCQLWHTHPPKAVYTGYNDGAKPKTFAIAICAAALKTRRQENQL